MSALPVNRLREIILLTATYYEKVVSEPLLEMYVEDLSDLPVFQVIEAYKEYRRNHKNRTFPLPAQIREIVDPAISSEALAIEAAARIPQAIAKFGWCNRDQAREFIGELGWSAIERVGGWQYVCENHGLDLKPQVFHAQVRELAKAHADLARAGTLGEAPALPEPQSSKGGAFSLQKPDVLKLVESLKPEDSK